MATGVPHLRAYSPDLTLPVESLRLRADPYGNVKRNFAGYLPVRGGSVNVRTKRREKRTKLLLRACGNIYPPFIVTPLFRNLKYIQRGPAPPPSSSLAYSLSHSAPFKRILCAQNERRRREMAPAKHGRTAESGGRDRGVGGRLTSCPRRPLFPASREAERR